MCWLELHEFDAGVVGIVEIELPFAVAADFGLLAAGPTVFAKLRFRGVDVWDAEGDVVHDAECVMIRVGWDIEHVFDPVGAIRNLHVNPVRFVVFHSAVPIDMEAEDVFVKVIFGRAIVNNKAGVDDPGADQRRRQRSGDTSFV